MDLDQIKALTDLMVANDLTEIMLRDGDNRIVIRRHAPGHAASGLPNATQTIPTVVAHAAGFAAGPAAHAAAPLPADAAETNGHVIKSPMVGTFFAAPDPDSPPFVSLGSRVEPETVVCIIEAMKVFNEIKADVSGVVER